VNLESVITGIVYFVIGGKVKTIQMKRVSMNEDGTFGVMIYENIPFLLTLERPWKDNAKGVSAIPLGTYIVKRTVTPLHGNTFEITNVPSRTAVLIHPGNTEIDSRGCPMVGMQFGKIEAIDPDTKQMEIQPAVLRSKDAYALLNNFIGEDAEFRLIITAC
jgi:Family of unknown function (DUF5675)